MRLFGRELYGLPRMVVICTTILLLASGLCGLQLLILSGANGNSAIVGFFMMTGAVELVAMVASAAAVVVLLIVWPISLLTNKKKDEAGENRDDGY